MNFIKHKGFTLGGRIALRYIHLSVAEQREIARMHAAKVPISVIADRLQRHRSTIYREFKRNWVHDDRSQDLSKLSRKLVLAA